MRVCDEWLLQGTTKVVYSLKKATKTRDNEPIKNT